MNLQKIVNGKNVVELIITPDMAREILTKMNNSNRGLSARTVNKYADDMKAGRWIPNQQNMWLGFYDDGTLADGQHRLAAVISAGVPMKFRVEPNLLKINAHAIDAHRPRRINDQIKISRPDHWSNNYDHSIARMIFDLYSRNLPSSQKLEDFLDEYKDRLLFIRGCFKDNIKGVTNTPIRVALFLASFTEELSDLSAFGFIVTHGFNSAGEININENVIIKLREKLLSISSRHRLNRMIAMKLAMRAIKSYCNYEMITSLRPPSDVIYNLPEDSYLFKEGK